MRFCLFGFLGGMTFLASGSASASEPVGFNRDIRPILSGHCFQCHGPDQNQRKAGVRLDVREQALTKAESGEAPLVPGRPDESELVRRILSDDPGEVMPPPSADKALSAAQKELLRRWVAEGAPYEKHWAFLPPQRREPPPVQDTAWPRNAIDRFVLARLEKEGLHPSPEAEHAALLRRLSLDLTGLPPGPDDVTAFEREMTAAVALDADMGAASQADGAARRRQTASADAVYEKWVDKLLDSPHYGERMAVDWLDAARYADSNGYQVDRDREAYAWRDWVIAAFNANMPFDQFTIEQLAGDLLPNPTLEQKIATGFHRNHMLNEEGGIIPEEFLAEYCADRVETTSTVWLGQTFTCVRCHDHKFDPFTQRDYYGLYAFFHNVAEKGVGTYGANIRRNAPPMIKLPSPALDAKVATLNRELGEAKQQLAETDTRLAAGQSEWEMRLREVHVPWQTAPPQSAKVGDAAISIESGSQTVRIPAFEPGEKKLIVEAQWPGPDLTALRLDLLAVPNKVVDGETAPAPPVFDLSKLRLFRADEMDAGMQSRILRAAEIEHALAAAEVAKIVDDSGKKRTKVKLKADAPTSLVVELDSPFRGDEPVAVRIELSLNAKDKTGPWELRLLGTGVDGDLLAPAEIVTLAKKEIGERTADEQKRLAEFHNSKETEHRLLSDRIAVVSQQFDEAELQIPTALVMEELPEARPTHILMRGAYNKPGELVTAATPAVLPPMSADLPLNRLGLARWLVDPANPLPARVTVSRFWQSLFGTGLVRTAEDFGTQGEPPAHPELLDWLATEFSGNGWNVKETLRLIVHSSTYRQSSRLTRLLRERDPDNRLLARGPRFRLQAEFLRDQALAASGLLVRKLGGAPVQPYHPPGLYEQVVSGSSSNTYVIGKGDDLYRRTMYSYWKRSVPNPAMLLFDVPFRETCTVRRPRTNTPLQALNLLNDPTYVEAARALAQRMLREGGKTDAARVTYGFRLVLVRAPHAAELEILNAAHQRALHEFEADPAGAAGLLKVGESAADAKLEPAQLAALTVVATTILNLDEAVMKE